MPLPSRTRSTSSAWPRSRPDGARLVWPGTAISVTGDAPTVTGDGQALSGVLRNLLDNASRAAGPAGTVQVELRSEGSTVVVDVADDGPGVPEADRERIFERLVRLDAARSADAGGSGLGLAIARGTARAYGGDLVCLPAPTGGALFRLTLPSSAPAA